MTAPPSPVPTPETPPAPGPLARALRRYRLRAPAGPRGRLGFWVILAAWGPCGFAPVAPGTFGTLGAIPLAWALSRMGWGWYAAVTLLVAAVGVGAAVRAGRYWGVVDASPIVIDEVAGYLITMAFVPFSWPAALLGFALFRVFDVTKPWPASYFDGVKSGFGVMMDDVAAGVWAWAALQLIRLALQALAGCDGGGFWCAALGA
ncbi:MAG: phosphatidylglycerophosphatase A [Anaeromyxobacter sp.]